MKHLKIFFLILFITASLSSQTTGSFLDTRDNKCYKTTHCGKQIWFAENFAFHSSHGQCHAYDNNDSLAGMYGYLYDLETARNVCPNGWRLPTLKDWQTLFVYLGMSSYEINSAMHFPSGTIADTLRKTLNIHYSGHRGKSGSYSYMNSSADIWIDHEIDKDKALRVWVADGLSGITTTRTYKQLGCSVRYVKDK